ncbi:hypothetical protein SLEP1_g1057 [Rubroshorea leprosula]|uniref:Uncharacterized protein n=1 Tax=Rubroshorea leprosula TaxID=152421 RepID=A0AAV5HNG3_9ROSI|nr:hypothetical protein SLEP1_g1057 [Rubroshorea leprosula]
MERQEILKIPTGLCSDSLIWHYDKNGEFTVKSAYLLACSRQHETNMDSTNMGLSSGEWKHLWKLKVPPNVRVFLWRAILNALPSMDNLVKRGIVQEALCPLCQVADESLMHLLFYCPHVEPIWFGSALGLDPRQLGVGCFVEWWKNFSSSGSCSSFWYAPRTLALKPERSIDNPSRPRPTTQQSQSSWSKPPHGTLKINVDASFSPNTGFATLAMVGRDSNGAMCFGKTWNCMALSPLMAETAALFKAIHFVENRGIHQAIFESDNQVLISSLQQSLRPLPWEAKTLIMHIRHLCVCHPGYSFVFVHRNGNRVADWIAHSSRTGQCPSYWAHRPPNILLKLLLDDVAST